MKEGRHIVLLSPARDIDVGKAAIQAGADAVYIGADKFGARSAAGNSMEDIAALVDYARIYNTQVLVTINTLLSVDERKEASVMMWQLYEKGVDAVIIQDLRLLNENLPPIRLHASTQCDNRTKEQVVRLQELGFHRAVLARELSLREMAEIRQATIQAAQGKEPIELEAFIHGALCVSYSGRCFMSEKIMGRSANRGECAQMCRMRYDLTDAKGNIITDDNGKPYRQQYFLSLQDMDRHRYLKQMMEAGITTFKIEGRLKDKDYVTNVTAFYRQLIDNITGSQPHRYEYNFTPNPEKTFHRGATAYFIEQPDTPMANFLSPKSTGEKIGTVLKHDNKGIHIDLIDNIVLHTGDGLCYDDTGFAVNHIGQNGNSAIVIPQTSDIQPSKGTTIYRSKDLVFLKNLQAERKIPVNIVFSETDNGFRLTLSLTRRQASPLSSADENKRITACIEMEDEKQLAKNEERALHTISRQLQKLGDTPYTSEHIEIKSRPYFIPVSRLNEWRRLLVEKAMKESKKQGAVNRNHKNDNNDLKFEDSGFPLQPDALMTCRYCLLREIGHCRKINPMDTEPKYLRLKNGRQMQLRFNCQRCEMELME